jgi:hypothetical protein
VSNGDVADTIYGNLEQTNTVRVQFIKEVHNMHLKALKCITNQKKYARLERAPVDAIT